MSLNSKQLFAITLASLVLFNYMPGVACQGVASGQTAQAGMGAETSSSGVKGQDNLLGQTLNGGTFIPVVFVRQTENGKTPDFILGWTSWQGLSQFSTFFKPLSDTFGPYSSRLSEALSRLPGVSSIATQFNTVGDQLSGQLNPMSLFGIGGGSSSGSSSSSSSGGGSGASNNPLSSLLQMG